MPSGAWGSVTGSEAGANRPRSRLGCPSNSFVPRRGGWFVRGSQTGRCAKGVIACLLGLAALAGCGASSLPRNYHQLDALYVIDHNGGNPKADSALAPYARAFQKVLAGCRTNPDDLTNETIALAEKSSDVGGRLVTNLAMLRAIARRITWPLSVPHGCGYIYNLAEAHMEAGGP